MKQDQKHTPKYWVIHDKTTDDVLIHTMHKSRQTSINLFNYNDLLCVLEDYGNLKCVLVEIKLIQEGG